MEYLGLSQTHFNMALRLAQDHTETRMRMMMAMYVKPDEADVRPASRSPPGGHGQ